jgi:hypothetical protein
MVLEIIAKRDEGNISNYNSNVYYKVYRLYRTCHVEASTH